MSAGQRLRAAIQQNHPLQVVGTVSAFSALLAEQSGHRALYLSGAGVANHSYGLPDLGITSLDNVLVDASRITAVTDLPLLVDADTGWGGAFNITRTIRELTRAGVAGCHIEDQVAQKRCGHRPNKAIVSTEEMVDRIKAAVDARTDDNFVIMARTDALAVEGMGAAIERACRCIEAGADALFPEALVSLNQYREICQQVGVPVLANITEFGKTPLFNKADLAAQGVSMVLYPLSAFRAMNKAAEAVYLAIHEDGDQKSVVDSMMTRDRLYEVLDYHRYEQTLDRLFENKG
jgi:methylisocitrate lyase